ncbi:hypothetical protein KP509_04G078900 [Ceratopteris richardii]|uniref:Pentatricopeptide repeat-containing protein n=1 Tax=Ceratopteris richardii TaxID=49495 RepID=A0A8T2UUE4_CERRI|nr:hypothetical protein KP509_04G078900 [Ceratopteris richardii]
MRRQSRWTQQERRGIRRDVATIAVKNVDIDSISRNRSGSLFPSDELGNCSPSGIASELRWCTKTENLSTGQSCHDYICRCALDSHPCFQGLLVQMYTNTQALDDALAVFSDIHHLHQDSVIWSHIINGLVKEQRIPYALQIYETMQQQSLLPDKFTFTSVLSAITCKERIQMGKYLHAVIITCGLHQHAFIATAMITMYQKCGSLEAALKTFMNVIEPDEEGIPLSKYSVCSILDVCTQCAPFNDEGKILHSFVIEHGIKIDNSLSNMLIKFYGACGSSNDAQHVYNGMNSRDLASSNSWIRVCSQHGQPNEAYTIFTEILEKGIKPNKTTYLGVIDACCIFSSEELAEGIIHGHDVEAGFEGRILHSLMIEDGIRIDSLLGNMLIKFYGACGSTNDAHYVYSSMPSRGLISSNIWIRVCCQHGQADEAYRTFSEILEKDMGPNEATYSGIIDVCCSDTAEKLAGRLIHSHVIEAGFDKNITLETRVLKMYAQCGETEDATGIYERMQEHTAASSGIMMFVLAWQGKSAQVISLFDQMNQEGTRPDTNSCLCMLDAFANSLELSRVKIGHVHVLNCILESKIVLHNYLISMYGKCGSLEDAYKVFESMPQHDLVSWTAMIGVYTQQGECEGALGIFSKMLLEVGASKVAYLCAIDACIGGYMLLEGRLVHFCIVHDGFANDNEILNALLNMHGKCGSVDDALHTFMFASARDVISWTSLVGAYAHHGQCSEALKYFNRMLQENVVPNKVTFINILNCVCSEKLLFLGKQIHSCIRERGLMPDVVVGNAIMKMYSSCESFGAAQKVFDCMSDRNVVSWTAIIAMYAQHYKGEEALDLFRQMQCTGVQPNNITFVCLLDACASSASLTMGLYIHSLVVLKNFESNLFISTALVNMYGKCGQLKSARRVFDGLRMRSLETWTAIIASYACYGEGKEAVKLFKAMEAEGFTADDASIVSILSAFSHSGLVEEGMHLFTEIMKDKVISHIGDYYMCMIDILGRAGRVATAEVLVQGMPVESASETFTSLIGA